MNEYFYLDSQNQQKGPVFPSQFSSLGITASTLVWCNGMEDWKPAGQIAELATYLVPPQPQGAPQQPPYGQPAPQNPYNPYMNTQGMIPPPSNLVWAILTTLLCCLPLGIVSIVYASQVDSEWSRGNVEGAFNKSSLARNWAIASAASAVGIWLIYLIVVFCGLLSAGSLY